MSVSSHVHSQSGMAKSHIKMIFFSSSTDGTKMIALKEIPKKVIIQKPVIPHKLLFYYIFLIERRNPFIPIELNRLSSATNTSKLERITLPFLTQSTSHGAPHHENTADSFLSIS